MLNFVRKTYRRLGQETGGSEIAEAAFVLPLMFMILIGIFWFGQAYNLYGAITRAAQEAARAGATPSCTTCAPGNLPGQNAANTLVATLTAEGLNPNSVQLPPTTPTALFCTTSGGQASCDSIATGIIKACVQTPAQLTSTVQAGAAGACGTIVTFQYPFNISIPFVANTRGFLLTATGRVRSETR